MTPKLYNRGIYMSHEHMAREKIAAMLTEAAVLIRGGTLADDTSVLLLIGLATIKFVDLDSEEKALNALTAILQERRATAA